MWIIFHTKIINTSAVKCSLKYTTFETAQPVLNNFSTRSKQKLQNDIQQHVTKLVQIKDLIHLTIKTVHRAIIY